MRFRQPSRFTAWFVVSLSLSLAACSDSSTPGGSSDAATVAEAAAVGRYAVVAKASYDDVVSKTRDLKAAVDAFVAAPAVATLEAARSAWLTARSPYGETEAFRFYGGPIDDEKEGPEGRVNGWPLDEAFIDSVAGDPTAGIINHPAEFPVITRELLSEQNEKGGEANIATGWHAIEFLLWGQDESETGPGARSFEDFVGTGPAQRNADRRRTYLQVVTALLLEDLEGVARAWDPARDGSFGARFLAAPPRESFTKAWKGIVMLSGLELSRERMKTAYTKGEQEEEHSCFSDNTTADLAANARAIENVYLGRRGMDDGPGLDEVVKAKDPSLDERVKERLAAALAAVAAIPAPFDQSILREPGRSKVKAALDAVDALTAILLEAAAAVSVTVNLER